MFSGLHFVSWIALFGIHSMKGFPRAFQYFSISVWGKLTKFSTTNMRASEKGLRATQKFAFLSRVASEKKSLYAKSLNTVTP